MILKLASIVQFCSITAAVRIYLCVYDEKEKTELVSQSVISLRANADLFLKESNTKGLIEKSFTHDGLLILKLKEFVDHNRGWRGGTRDTQEIVNIIVLSSSLFDRQRTSSSNIYHGDNVMITWSTSEEIAYELIRRHHLTFQLTISHTCHLVRFAHGIMDYFEVEIGIAEVYVGITLVVFLIISWLAIHRGLPRYISLADEILRKIARKKVGAMRTLVLDDDFRQRGQEHCAVCLEEFCGGETIRELPCQHCFHVYCVDDWLIEKQKCPLCKFDVVRNKHIKPD